MGSHWVSVDEVAKHLGVAKDTVYRWIEKRGLPAHRVGRLWKFQIFEVDQWVKSDGANSSKDEQGGVGKEDLTEGRIQMTRRGTR